MSSSPQPDGLSMQRAIRVEQLLGAGTALDRPLAVVGSVDGDDPPGEDEVVAALDRLSAANPATEAGELLARLFGPGGFAGNLSDYYDPANSLIHRVLQRRRGIPLSLAAVASEVARRQGLDLRPVGMPGHVLLGEGPVPSRWYDPFAVGTPLDVEGCRAIFERIQPNGTFHEAMLAAMDPRSVVVRTLNNLRVAFASRGQASRLVPVLALRANLRSGTVGDHLELARLLAGLGRVEQAAAEFDLLARLDPERADGHRARATGLRARLN